MKRLKRELIMAPPRPGVLPPETKEALAFQKKEKNKRAESGRIDSCCVCGKALFKSGKRQDSLCWQIAILKKEAIKAAGIYTDSSGACVFVCKDCFNKGHKTKIINALFQGHEKAERLRKEAEEFWR